MSVFQVSGANFSPCRRYRYSLWRVWDSTKPLIQFIGLNPSTASESQDDPTIRRVIRFASDWGYGGIYMTNLFAIVSSNPKDILTCEDPIADNDLHLEAVRELCAGNALFAWGAFKECKERAQIVAKRFPGAVCLGRNADGSPKHPLYIKAETRPEHFKP